MGGIYQAQNDWYEQILGSYTYSGTQFANRRFDHLGYANALAGDLIYALSGMQAMNAIESRESRARRLLAEAKSRHPEWQVKKLQRGIE